MNNGSVVNLVGDVASAGVQGYSAYEIAVQNGFVGTEEEWVDSFLTPDGYLKIKDVIDKLNSVIKNKPLSANQGRYLKQLIDENLQLINQKQLEIGAVPSDNQPGEESSHWVTSGGIYRALEPLRGYTYIKNVSTFLDEHRVNYWIAETAFSNNTTGKHVAYPITNEKVLLLKGHDTRGSYYAFVKSYTVPEAEDDLDFCDGFTERSFIEANTSERISIPGDCAYVVVGIVNGLGVSYKPQMLGFEYVENRNFEYSDAVDTGSIITNILEKGANNKGWLNGSNWNSGGRHYVIPVNKETHLHIKSKTDKNSYYVFLKTYTPPIQADEAWDACDGYELRQQISPNTDVSIELPEDCNYVVIGYLNAASSTDFLPVVAELTYETELKKRVDTLGNGVLKEDYIDDISLNSQRTYLQNETTSSETYSGERINVADDFVKTHYFTHYALGVNKNLHNYNGLSQQGLAIYGDYAFFTYHSGYIRVFNLSTEEIVAEYPMPEGVQHNRNHAGNANFGTEFLEDTDDFPLLYISSYQENKCYVLRVSLEGCEWVQTIYITTGELDEEENPIIDTSIWHFYVDNDNRLITHGSNGLMVFYLPDTSERTVYIDGSKPILNVRNPLPSYTFAGVAARNGNLYILAYAEGEYSHLFVYNYEQCRIISKLVFPSNIHNHEFEGIGFWDKDIIVGYNGWNQLMGYKFL